MSVPRPSSMDSHEPLMHVDVACRRDSSAQMQVVLVTVLHTDLGTSCRMQVMAHCGIRFIYLIMSADELEVDAGDVVPPCCAAPMAAGTTSSSSSAGNTNAGRCMADAPAPVDDVAMMVDRGAKSRDAAHARGRQGVGIREGRGDSRSVPLLLDDPGGKEEVVVGGCSLCLVMPRPAAVARATRRAIPPRVPHSLPWGFHPDDLGARRGVCVAWHPISHVF